MTPHPSHKIGPPLLAPEGRYIPHFALRHSVCYQHSLRYANLKPGCEHIDVLATTITPTSNSIGQWNSSTSTVTTTRPSGLRPCVFRNLLPFDMALMAAVQSVFSLAIDSSNLCLAQTGSLTRERHRKRRWERGSSTRNLWQGGHENKLSRYNQCSSNRDRQ